MVMPKEVGQIVPDSRSPPASFLWTIENFFAHPQVKDGYTISSPWFSCIGSEWYLEIRPSVHIDGMRNTELRLWKYLDSAAVRVSFRFGILGRGGTEIMVRSGEREFTKDGCCTIFRVGKPLYQRDKKFCAPDGHLTIFCNLRHIGDEKEISVSGRDASTQTETANTDAGQSEAANSTGKDVGLQTDDDDDWERSDVGRAKSSDLKGVHRCIQDLKNLFLSERDTDLILQVGGRKFSVHRAVLVARCRVFEAMMTHDMAEKQSSLVEITDCDPDAFRDFLIYLYAGEVDELSESNVLHLYKAVDKYDVEDLKQDCIRFIKSKLSVEMFCDVVALALRHNEQELLQEATVFFASNLETILVSVAWQAFLKENFMAGNELYIKALKYHGVLK